MSVPKRRRRWTMPAALATVVIVVLLGAFALHARHVGWPWNVPTKITVDGRDYQLGAKPPSHALPSDAPYRVVTSVRPWLVTGPFEVFGRAQRERNAILVLHWSDGAYYDYTLEGSP